MIFSPSRSTILPPPPPSPPPALSSQSLQGPTDPNPVPRIFLRFPPPSSRPRLSPVPVGGRPAHPPRHRGRPRPVRRAPPPRLARSPPRPAARPLHPPLCRRPSRRADGAGRRRRQGIGCPSLRPRSLQADQRQLGPPRRRRSLVRDRQTCAPRVAELRPRRALWRRGVHPFHAGYQSADRARGRRAIAGLDC